MVQVIRWDSPDFTEAFLIWTAWGRYFMPRRDDASVIARFGTEAASRLLPAIKAAMDEFYESDAKYTAPNLVEMGARAKEQFRAKHPEVADDVLKAMEWCYTFSNR